ncbi:twin-arginine translocation signal domain-containing protein, partial [Burkholderia vietnamiensis]
MSNQDTFTAESNESNASNEPAASVSRRGFLKLAGVSSLATAASGL